MNGKNILKGALGGAIITPIIGPVISIILAEGYLQDSPITDFVSSSGAWVALFVALAIQGFIIGVIFGAIGGFIGGKVANRLVLDSLPRWKLVLIDGVIYTGVMIFCLIVFVIWVELEITRLFFFNDFLFGLIF